MACKVEPELRAMVKANNGYAVKAERTQGPRATLYKPSGEPMPNMPIDAFHLQKYLKRGFTLYPPEKVGQILGGKKGSRGRPRKDAQKQSVGVE